MGLGPGLGPQVRWGVVFELGLELGVGFGWSFVWGAVGVGAAALPGAGVEGGDRGWFQGGAWDCGLGSLGVCGSGM